MIFFLNHRLLLLKCLTFLVDCVWGEWNIGVCSNECGGGHQINIREKIQEELFGGKPCEGEASVEEECNMHNCPGNQIQKSVYFVYQY